MVADDADGIGCSVDAVHSSLVTQRSSLITSPPLSIDKPTGYFYARDGLRAISNRRCSD